MKSFINLVLILVLSFFSRSIYAQQFSALIDASLYTPVSIPSDNNKAVLLWTVQPDGSTVSSSRVLSTSVLKSFNRSGQNVSWGGYGYIISNGDNTRTYVSIIDSENMYVRSDVHATIPILFPQIQSHLINQGLGTVAQRQIYIHSLHSALNVNPASVLFLNYIKPWVVIGFAIFLSLPMWWVIKRALR